MTIAVQLFARLKDLVGSGQISLEIPATGKVADLKQSLARAYPQVAPLLSSLHVAVGTNYADDDTVLSSDVPVACFPPVSGG